MRLPARLLALPLAAALLSSALPATAGAGPAEGPLLYVSNRNGNAQIRAMSPDGAIDRALTATAEENTEPAWSPDGRLIAFTSYRDGNGELYVMNADGSQQRRLTQHPAADNAPAWLPDGRIVFRSVRTGTTNFYVINADGSGLKALTDTATDKGPPMVSPDGRWIAHVAHGEKGRSDIHLLPASGGAPRDLTSALSTRQKIFAAWLPDSRHLAYMEAKDTSLNIRVIGLEGGPPLNLTDNAFVNAGPVWSPDGRRVAFVTNREGTRSERARGDIHVMNADGSGTVNLTRHPDEDNYPAWSADGQRIYFVSLRDGRPQIYSVSAEGGDAVRLTRSEGADLMVRPLASQNH